VSGARAIQTEHGRINHRSVGRHSRTLAQRTLVSLGLASVLRKRCAGDKLHVVRSVRATRKRAIAVVALAVPNTNEPDWRPGLGLSVLSSHVPDRALVVRTLCRVELSLDPRLCKAGGFTSCESRVSRVTAARCRRQQNQAYGACGESAHVARHCHPTRRRLHPGTFPHARTGSGPTTYSGENGQNHWGDIPELTVILGCRWRPNATCALEPSGRALSRVVSRTRRGSAWLSQMK
jgi:hypothetical protein